MLRDDLLTRLELLLPSQFEEVLFWARVPIAHLSGGGASQAVRAMEAIRYLEQRNQLDLLAAILGQVTSGALATPPVMPEPTTPSGRVLEHAHWQGIARRVLAVMRFREADEELSGALALDDVAAEETARDGRLRRVASLSHELVTSTEPLVLVEGPAGSGKSVLLRRLALELAALAEAGLPPLERSRTRRARWVATAAPAAWIPLYVNLRDLGPPGSATPHAIEQQVRRLILDEWGPRVPGLAAMLDGRIGRGRWLVLLDSFDEIPALLGSTDFDHSAVRHAKAIEALAAACSSTCRFVVASRPYRSPGRRAWVRYRLLPLSDERCLAIARSRFAGDGDRAQRFLGDLQTSRLTGWKDCPLILDVLCEDYLHCGALSRSLHDAFDGHVQRCLKRRGVARGTPGILGLDLFDAAQRLAFFMTAHSQIGLTVDTDDAAEVIRALTGNLDFDARDALANLVEVGLARSSTPAPGSERFAFRHRRIQEYFATASVRAGAEVSVDELLTSERWRETAIALLQSGDVGRVEPLLHRAAELLEDGVKQLQWGHASVRIVTSPEALTKLRREQVPIEFPQPGGHVSVLIPTSLEVLTKQRREGVPIEFPWPEHTVHILRILNTLSASWGDRDSLLDEVTARVRTAATAVLILCAVRGVRDDVVVAIELSGVALDPVRDVLLSWACTIPSEWLDDTVFLEASALRATPPAVLDHVRHMLVRRALDGELRGRRISVETQLQRIDRTGELRRAARWLVAVDRVDAVLWCAFAALFVASALAGGAGVGMATAWQWVWGPCAAFLSWSMTPRIFRRLWGAIPIVGAALAVGLARQLLAATLLSLPWRVTPELPRWLLELVAWLAGGLIFLLVPARTFVWLAVRLGYLRRWYMFVPAYLAVTVVVMLALVEVTQWTGWMTPLTEQPVIALVVLAAGSMLGSKLLWDWLHDKVVGRRLRRVQVALNAEQILTNARRLHLSWQRAGYLRWVREHGGLQPTSRCERMLRDAVLAIERDQLLLVPRFPSRWRTAEPPDLRAWSEPFVRWYRDEYQGRRAGMAAWGDTSLDEIIRIRHQAAAGDAVAG
jgi:hypothetical protein